MKCKKCNSENPDNALFCRVCGYKLNENSKSSFYGIFNVLFWIGLIFSIYSLISVVVPIESYHQYPDGTKSLYCSDFLGLNSDSKSYYMDEWEYTLAISTFITAILFSIRSKTKK